MKLEDIVTIIDKEHVWFNLTGRITKVWEDGEYKYRVTILDTTFSTHCKEDQLEKVEDNGTN